MKQPGHIGYWRWEFASLPFTRWMDERKPSFHKMDERLITEPQLPSTFVPALIPPYLSHQYTPCIHTYIHATIHSITTSCFQFLKSQGPVLGAQVWQGSNWAPPIQGQLFDDSHQETCRHRLRHVLQNTHGEAEHVLWEAFGITHQVNILIALFICWQTRVIDARLRRLATDLNVSFLANLNAKMGISQCF